jgi:hypothetical protein
MSSIKLHRWDCTECGTNQGKNDQWHEGDVCDECYSRKLTDKETEYLKVFCPAQEVRIKKEMGLNKISGGFCTVEFESCDSNEIILKVKFGNSDDTGSNVHLTQIILDRDSLYLIEDY